MDDMPNNGFTEQSTAGQYRIQALAFVIAISICLLFSSYFAISTLSGVKRTCEIKLDGRINPNDAPIASLIRLPGIGLGRASAIVEYRENLAKQNGGSRVFQNCDDLDKVKGIGPKTVQNICEHLKFE